ncbi:protein-methionine-sulfoxide reductase heme-binding subunit MsrQ [Halodurantibacterium flavum]|uniref:Protein-methionine-sulfoxide reductase heme-binding subunit MsrQ n=1 Tax=Halodurantibacterium flavum TaxID=1382802 RepID=A0ABW4S9G1_9RHOB
MLRDAIRRIPVWLVWVLGLLPLVWLVVQAFRGGLGVDPVKALEHRLGLHGLQFLLLGLAITPLRRLGLNLLRFRRAIGLIAFTYVMLHFAVWLSLDMQFEWNQIGRDLVRRPYILIGMAGLLLLIPLALTSNDASLRRLGARRWRLLHRLTYVAVLAGALHFVLLVKGWPAEPFLYLGAAAALLLLRLLWVSRRASV